jgi:predicted HicB family RNase H-like nuclease
MINVLEYKGYKASIKFDDEDQIIIGRVLDIDDIIIFHGESVTQFEKAFHQSINSYMKDCRD